MKELKISVIVPIYNAETYLKKCIESIVNQTYSNLEIILINDGSTDNSVEIITEFASRDNRIKVVNQENQGLVYSRKIGMNIVSGDYITFVDADDYIDIDAYQGFFDSLDNTMPDIVCCGMIEEFTDERRVKFNNMKELDLTAVLSTGCFFNFGIIPNIWCKFLKKSFIDTAKVFVSDSVSYGEDVDFIFQYIVQAKSVQILDEAYYHYCKRDDTMVWRDVEPEKLDTLYNDLKKGFIHSNTWDIMKSQLDDYINFVRLLKCPQLVDGISDVFDGQRVALYGAGGFGTALYNRFKSNITVWVDKKTDKNPIAKLVETRDDYDKIYIAILNTNLCEMIKREISEIIDVEIVYYFAFQN